MEFKVKPKAIESTVMMVPSKVKGEMKKEVMMIGQKTDQEEEINSTTTEQAEPMKIIEGLKQNLADHSKSHHSRSSSTLDEVIKKLENGKNSSQNLENTKKEDNNNNNNLSNMKDKKTSSHVWDCGSSLYDSFELNSFKRQLDSAISASSARTLSMSHLPDRRLPPLDSLSPQFSPPPPPATSSSSSGGKKHSNKISRSLQRFLKSMFRPKRLSSSSSTPSSPVYKRAHGGDTDRYYVVYDKSGSLTTIPESTEKEVGPEINAAVRKTVSERFPASRVVGISCA